MEIRTFSMNALIFLRFFLLESSYVVSDDLKIRSALEKKYTTMNVDSRSHEDGGHPIISDN